MAYNYYGQGWWNQPGYSMNNSAMPAVQAMQYPPQQSYAPAPQQTQGMIWVDGEVGAKAYQMPNGWPVGTPIPLWDTNDQIIYLKSMNQMGMPNPLQKIRYTMDEQPAGHLQSGAMASEANNYVTREDLEKMMAEMKELFRPAQGRNQSGQNRGGGNQ